MHALSDQLQAAHERRQPWLSALEDTTAYRQRPRRWIGIAGRPPSTKPRPRRGRASTIHRGRPTVEPEPLAGAALDSHTVLEEGLRFAFQARHRGIDPWLFLDFRAGRRRVRAEAAGKRVLNLFAYTCTMGVAAAADGATAVLNIDFAESALRVGRDNAALNGIADGGMEAHKADVLPTLRQLGAWG